MNHTSSTVQTTATMPRRGTTVRVDRDLLQSMLDEAIDLTQQLLRGPRDPDSHKHVGMNALQLVDRASTVSSAPDGWSDHSAGADAPEKIRRVLDEEGNPIEGEKEPRPPHSDSTGGAALASLNGMADRDRAAVTQLAQNVSDALDLLRGAMNRLHKAQPPDSPIGTGDVACTSHARLRRFEPADTKYPGAELCRWCYDWRSIHGKVPPLPILEMRVAGLRITPAVMKKYKLSA